MTLSESLLSTQGLNANHDRSHRPRPSNRETTSPRSILAVITAHISALINHLKSATQRCRSSITWVGSRIFEGPTVGAPKSDKPSVLLQIGYSLQLKLHNKTDGNGTITIHDEKALPPSKDESLEKTGISGASPGYQCRLFLDWQTSFLWYDTLSLRTTSDEFEVDDGIIEERYPALTPFYFTWREDYEDSFEKQQCHLGIGQEVFPDIAARVAWEVAGFLIACWLVRQDDVECVTYYILPTGVYEIRKDGMDDVLKRFFIDVDALLSKEKKL
ncbi:hypothetical protein AJ80_06576 [Polytolypa hystricis UAMH7299]|uniref:Uncharacterized protein n=1 Tax=Polytolypa hystricis (strain UAMH7299) TaxID=1447883 RepID=A0A2B7XWI2_POLH7|nr:hypothetical protein AJ80_06576 [Polytolypa hystricis UAMH7299]